MRTQRALLSLAAVLVFCAATQVGLRTALADDDDKPAEALPPGELHLATSYEFVKFSIDGEAEWENHEYTNKNKTLVIKGLAVEKDHRIVLTARDKPELDEAVVDIKQSDFKKEKIKGNLYKLVARKVVKFSKKSDKPAAPPAAPPKAPDKTEKKDKDAPPKPDTKAPEAAPPATPKADGKGGAPGK